MSFLYEKPASTSAESLLSVESDVESGIPQPEPLGTSKALSPAPFHKWWWRKKPNVANPVSRSPPRPGVGTGKSLAALKDKVSASTVPLQTSATFLDGKVGLILVLLLVLAMTTLITVQFKDSELILAIFTALALFILGTVYYFHCCGSNTSWFSRKAKTASGEFSPLVLPITSTASPAVAMEEIKGGTSLVSSSEKLLAIPANPVKASPHRRDWSLPTMSTSALLSHRRPTTTIAQVMAASPAGHLQETTSAQRHTGFQDTLSKLRIEFNIDQPVVSRIEHLSAALNMVASSTKESIWVHEARLADAITCALTSCMSSEHLTEIKMAMDRELRRADVNEKYATLHAAVFSFLQKGERDAVLTHLLAVHKITVDTAESTDSKPRQRLLISDIDDTLVPTFKDRRGFSWGVPYPGVRQLYKELTGVTDATLSREGELSLLQERVAFVTARPGILRNWTKQEIAKAGFEGSIILMGFATTATTPQGMLAQKVKQVRELKSLWPECDVILVGDNGQRDIDLGATLMKEGLVQAVFIHDIFASEDEVTRTSSTSLGAEMDVASLQHSNSSSSYVTEDDDPEEPLNMTEDERVASIQAKPMVRLSSAPAALGTATSKSFVSLAAEQKRLVVLEPSVPIGFRHNECTEAGIDLFQTYAGAALKCYQKGLLGVEALERVARACSSDLGSTSIDGQVKQRLVDSLLRDVARVALEFTEKTPSEKFDFLEFVHEAIKGSPVLN